MNNSLNPIIPIPNSPLYRCTLCRRDNLEGLIAAHSHLALVHPGTDLLLRSTIDKYPTWYFLVYAKQNPIHKPGGGYGAVVPSSAFWQPIIWSVVEYKSDSGTCARGTPRIRNIVRIRTVKGIPSTLTSKYPHGTIHNAAASIIYTVSRTRWKRYKLGPTYGTIYGNLLWSRLNGRNWCIVPALEVQAWITGQILAKRERGEVNKGGRKKGWNKVKKGKVADAIPA